VCRAGRVGTAPSASAPTLSSQWVPRGERQREGRLYEPPERHGARSSFAMATPTASPPALGATNARDGRQWSARRVTVVVALFVLAACLEIGGCYFLWRALRLKRDRALALAGAIALTAYGTVFVLVPMDDFGRIMAVYGGFFIVMSYAFGVLVEGFVMDVGDFVGAAVALTGVLVCMLWPR